MSTRQRREANKAGRFYNILNAATQMARVNFDSHIATKFFSRTRRWIRLQLGHKMHFANMEERRVKSWVSLLCRAATEDGSIWDLLPMYTRLSAPPQDGATDLETLVATMQSLMGPLPVTDQYLRRESGCTLSWQTFRMMASSSHQDEGRPKPPEVCRAGQ
ncbi:TPA: hypothetical protein ACH3X1_000544 [Trebouxia sp. C0004]